MVNTYERRKTKHHEFQGEAEGKPLAEWLGSRASDSHRRVETILRLFQEILHIEREQREKHSWQHEPMLGKLGIRYAHDRSAEVESLRRELDKRLVRYRGYRAFIGQVPASERVRLMFVATSRQTKPDEVRAVNAVSSLLAQGLLRRMRQCQQCRRWYFARFDNQLSCSQKCRIRHSQSKPEWKEEHNRKRREYYQYKHRGTRKVSTRRGRQ